MLHYDDNGRSHRLHYNELGFCTVETHPYGPGGRIETIQLPDGTTAHYHYDPQGRWHTLSVNGDTLIERTFDSQNQETTRTAGSNTQSQLHDRYGCLIKRKWQGQQSATRRYRWDAENRLEATEDSLTGSTHYQRDSQGQLTEENDTEYHYDLGGNRVPEGGLLQQDRLLTTATDKRDYDALGAEVRITGQTTEHRTFDAEGQLIEFKRPSLHITYGYDALGRRAWRKTDAGTTTYLWHNDVLLGEQSPKGDWQWYLRDPKTDEPLITLIGNQPYYYELDHRMIPVRLWDQSGQKVWEGHADAWGKCEPDTLNNSIHQPLRLPGQFEDELTGIVQNRFRDYDPGTGRYLTPDPYGLKGGLNGYRYTPNPVDYVDPLGLDFEPVVTAGNADAGEEAALSEGGPEMAELQPLKGFMGPVPVVGAAAATATASATAEAAATVSVGTLVAGLATFVGGMLYSPSLGGGLEEITAADGTVYSKHGDERIWNANGANRTQWQTEDPQLDMEYRTWLANGGDGSFAVWMAEGKPTMPSGEKNSSSGAYKPEYSSNFEKHLTVGDGLSNNGKGGLSGTHNQKEFFKAAQKGDILIVSGSAKPHPDISGIIEYSYRARTADGTGFRAKERTKTVYDPEVISDQEFVQWSKEAINDGADQVSVSATGEFEFPPTGISGQANNGLKFEGGHPVRENSELGKADPSQVGKITAVYPVVP